MKLSDWLKSTGTKCATFAQDIGVAPSTVYRLTNDEIQPTLPLMRRIADATGRQVMPNDFLPEAEDVR